MRFMDLDQLLNDANQDVVSALGLKDQSILTKTDLQKSEAVAAGNRHWRPMKEELERLVGRKCWYTESKNSGCLNDLEHFRPKGKVTDNNGTLIHWYWFLAFNPINYRLSAQIPNRLNDNIVLGATGGKGDNFPLLNGSIHGTNLAGALVEMPALLDPCCEEDTNLIEFHPDGRPVISRQFSDDKTAVYRVKQSNLLLNLDYSSFNEDREALYNKIRSLIEDRGDGYYEAGNCALEDTKQDLRNLMLPESEYSKAAECYIRGFRDRRWVEELLFE
jgi:hypothetical protein